jgi:hypothetical protein
MTNKKKTDPIPEKFNSYEEAAEFWDTHDTAEYLQDSHPVKVISEFRGRGSPSSKGESHATTIQNHC